MTTGDKQPSRIIMCGSKCEHRHDGVNGPTGCCPKGHGPYLYYCTTCHDEWAEANPERVKVIRRLAGSTWRGIDTTKPKDDLL
jgi:hypothetical protein